MRYLTLAAEYTGSALRDDFAGPVMPEDIGVSHALSDRIRDWNVRYRAIIPLDVPDRAQSPAADLIRTLDEEGLSLVGEIGAAHSEFKIRYFSEGLLRYVT
jgi:hypothetical protein